MDTLKIYCPDHEKMIKLCKKEKYDRFLVQFNRNPFFLKFTPKVIRYLSKLPRPKLIEEALRFWYMFFLGQPTFHVNDHGYYPKLLQFFIKKQIIKYEPVYRPFKNTKRYVIICYKNNKFFFIKTFTSITEIEDFFQIRIKIEKRDYKIIYK